MIYPGIVRFDDRQIYRGADSAVMRFGTRALGQFDVPVFTGGPKPAGRPGEQVTTSITWLGPEGAGCDPFWTEQNGACSDEFGNFIEPEPGKRPPFDWRAWVKKNQTALYVGAAVVAGLAVMGRRR